MAKGIVVCLFFVFLISVETSANELGPNCSDVSTVPVNLCGKLVINCGHSCGTLKWTLHKDFYKVSECNSSSCEYCYIGHTVGFSSFQLTATGVNVTYICNVTKWNNNKARDSHVLPRESMVPKIWFRHGYFYTLPLRFNSFLRNNYDLIGMPPAFTIKPGRAKMVPPNGRTLFYTYHSEMMYSYACERDITWYSALSCNISKLNWTDLRNDPLLSMNCENILNQTISYEVSNSLFRMEKNYMYFNTNNWSGTGRFNFTVSAEYADLVKSKTEIDDFFEVDQLYITKLTALKESKNRYIFKCYTNSTSDHVKYDWYWKGDLMHGKGSMEDGKSVGKFVYDEMSDEVSGDVICFVSGNALSYSKTKSINTEMFPVVRLNKTSDVIKNGIPVNVSCHLLPKFKNSKLYLKINNKEMMESKVSVTKESNVSCYGINDMGRGEIETLHISVMNEIGRKSKDRKLGDRIDPKDAKKSIIDAKSELSKIKKDRSNFGPAMERLANATKQNMTAADISGTIDALDIAMDITNCSKQVSKKEVQGFVDIVSNLVGNNSAAKWGTLQKKNNLTAASVLKSIEDFGRIASQKINRSLVIPSENLVLELQKVNMNENVQFPSTNNKHQKWVEESSTKVFVPSEIFKNAFEANESVTMNAVLFKDMKDLLPKSRNNDSLNSYVLAISFGKPLVNLTEDISLTFSHLSTKGFKIPSCNFWDFQINPELGGSWSTKGCRVQSSNSTHTICSCDHLTNFGILMEIVPHNHRKIQILDKISNVGCLISISSLIVTMLVYCICWKHVTSQDVTKSQSILLMNLCISLISAYILFVTMAKDTGNKRACTVAAALIFYFFLVSFFTMLAEGIDMTIALTVVFTSKFNRLPWLVALSWGGPAIIVIITLAVTRTVGFGNERVCWLTSESYLNLAFIVPVSIIILVNLICAIVIMKTLLSAHSMLRESTKHRLRIGARAIGILTPLLGLSWAFGPFAFNEEFEAFEYIFVVTNSLQGLFIFLAYCVFNNQIRRALCNREKTPSQEHAKDKSTDKTCHTKSTELSNISGRDSTISDYPRELSDIKLPNVYKHYSFDKHA